MEYDTRLSVDENIKRLDSKASKKGARKSSGKNNQSNYEVHRKRKLPAEERNRRRKLTDKAVADFPAASKLLEGTDLFLRQCNCFTYQIKGRQGSSIRWCLNCYPSTHGIYMDRTCGPAPTLMIKNEWNLFDLANAALREIGLPVKDRPKLDVPEEVIRALANRAMCRDVEFTEEDLYCDFKEIIDNW